MNFIAFREGYIVYVNLFTFDLDFLPFQGDNPFDENFSGIFGKLEYY